MPLRRSASCWGRNMPGSRSGRSTNWAPAAIFRRHRVDEVPQRKIAEEFGVSLSTVESDLRRAYRALAELKERMDEV